MPFEDSLQQGRIGESIIARWCIARGQSILPAYEVEMHHGKGPRFYTAQGTIVAPDMFVMPSMLWIEAKHKTVFTWHRITQRWCTGIDLHHYAEYQRVQAITGRPVWLFFLHRQDAPDARDIEAHCPGRCPTGLFCGSLKHLMDHENHRHDNWGKHGMVYWAHESLRLVATLEDVDYALITMPGPDVPF